MSTSSTLPNRKILKFNVDVPEDRAEEVMRSLEFALKLVLDGMPGVEEVSPGFDGPDIRRFRLSFGQRPN